LFLLIGNVADELTQALLTVAVARQAKIKHITYLSVYQVERFPDVSHFVSKYAVETALKAFDTPFTVLRPGYFFQNDAQLKPVLAEAGLYPTPIGKAGIAAIDVRDIADAAAVSLTTDGHTGKTYNLVAPDPLSGPGAAAIWSEVLKQANSLRRPSGGSVRGATPSNPSRLVGYGPPAYVSGMSGPWLRSEQRRCYYVDLADRPCA
jgi:uncharacterized protein YbjT (DUF2867 family)